MKMELQVAELMIEAPISVEALTALHKMLKAGEPCPANLFGAFPNNPGFDAKVKAIVATALAIATDSYISGIVRDLRIASHHANPDDFRGVRFLWLCMSNPAGFDSETWDREWSHWSQKATRPAMANQALLLIEGAVWAPENATHPEELILRADPKDVAICHADTHRFMSGRLLNAPKAKLVFPATPAESYR